jgi:thiol:disulfide interchange protein DsbD
LIGAAFFAAALYFAATGIDSKIESARSSLDSAHQEMGVDWRAYSKDIYAQAAREKKPIIIDFYADWCAPCKELDEKTFSTRAVIDESKKFIMIKVDLTSAGDPQVEALRNKHQAVGVPTLVYLAPDGNEISKLRGTGFETKEEMVEKMKMALTVAGS